MMVKPPVDAAATVIVAVAVALPEAAVTVAEPAATAMTSPPLFTVATAELLELQAIAWPATALPDASFGVAVSWTDCPTASVEAVVDSETVATDTVVPPIVIVPAVESYVTGNWTRFVVCCPPIHVPSGRNCALWFGQR